MNDINEKLVRKDLVYPELSYELVGCAFEVFNELGPGHVEKNYQKAFAVMLKLKNIAFSEQVYYPLVFKGKVIGKNFLDFLIDGKVIIELKKDQYFSKTHIDQVLNYLKLSNLQLAILINFSKTGITYKRIVNISNS